MMLKRLQNPSPHPHGPQYDAAYYAAKLADDLAMMRLLRRLGGLEEEDSESEVEEQEEGEDGEEEGEEEEGEET